MYPIGSNQFELERYNTILNGTWKFVTPLVDLNELEFGIQLLITYNFIQLKFDLLPSLPINKDKIKSPFCCSSNLLYTNCNIRLSRKIMLRKWMLFFGKYVFAEMNVCWPTKRQKSQIKEIHNKVERNTGHGDLDMSNTNIWFEESNFWIIEILIDVEFWRWPKWES